MEFQDETECLQSFLEVVTLYKYQENYQRNMNGRFCLTKIC